MFFFLLKYLTLATGYGTDCTHYNVVSLLKKKKKIINTSCKVFQKRKQNPSTQRKFAHFSCRLFARRVIFLINLLQDSYSTCEFSCYTKRNGKLFAYVCTPVPVVFLS